MNKTQATALLNAHRHLLHRIAEVEADVQVTREALLRLFLHLAPDEARSAEFDQMIDSIQKNKWSIADREAGKFQDEIFGNSSNG
jgi:hypothetical protein